MIEIEVVYAAPQQQVVLAFKIDEGTTIQDAIKLSGILVLFPEIDLSKQKIGIFSKPCELTHVIQAGDRIEIYRPLVIDPKEARRARDKAARAKK